METALAVLRRDYSKLEPRIRALTHDICCESDGVVLRLHFPSFRQGQATIHELTDAISRYLIKFSLPRSQVKALDDLWAVDQEEFIDCYNELDLKARELFRKANEATNRNGEAGELLLYLLTEWILDAPQLIAKMSLKTNRDMPVHGADGVHVRYCLDTQRLLLYWGEAKFYSNISQALSAAVKSIIEILNPEKMKHEIDLVQRNIDFSGLDDQVKQILLRYLDPYEENYNERHDVITCLIGFDFEAFQAITPTEANNAEEKFSELAKKKLKEIVPLLAKKLADNKLNSVPIEIFFFPVPSVQTFRDLFQEKIGWRR